MSNRHHPLISVLHTLEVSTNLDPRHPTGHLVGLPNPQNIHTSISLNLLNRAATTPDDQTGVIWMNIDIGLAGRHLTNWHAQRSVTVLSHLDNLVGNFLGAIGVKDRDYLYLQMKKQINFIL